MTRLQVLSSSVVLRVCLAPLASDNSFAQLLFQSSLLTKVSLSHHGPPELSLSTLYISRRKTLISPCDLESGLELVKRALGLETTSVFKSPLGLLLLCGLGQNNLFKLVPSSVHAYEN